MKKLLILSLILAGSMGYAATKQPQSIGLTGLTALTTTQIDALVISSSAMELKEPFVFRRRPHWLALSFRQGLGAINEETAFNQLHCSGLQETARSSR